MFLVMKPVLFINHSLVIPTSQEEQRSQRLIVPRGFLLINRAENRSVIQHYIPVSAYVSLSIIEIKLDMEYSFALPKEAGRVSPSTSL